MARPRRILRNFNIDIPWDSVLRESPPLRGFCEKCRIREHLFEEFTVEQLQALFTLKPGTAIGYWPTRPHYNHYDGFLYVQAKLEHIHCVLQLNPGSRYQAAFESRELGADLIYEFDIDAAKWLGLLSNEDVSTSLFHGTQTGRQDISTILSNGI